MKTATISHVTFGTFLEQVKAQKVQRVTLRPERIDYILKPDFGFKRFYTTRPADNTDDIPALLRRYQVDVVAPVDNTGAVAGLMALLLSSGALMGTLAWLLKTSPGADAMGTGKTKARTYSPTPTRTRQGEKTAVTFADVAGVDEAKQELKEVVDFLKDGAKYRKIGAKLPKGVLLVGPPGTGKTLLAKAVAGEANVPFLSVAASEFVELYVGVGASRVRDLFNKAKKLAPCIVFIDELDAIGKSRSGGNPNGGNDEREQTLNQLLTEMDGFDGDSGVILIGATNRPEILDPALKRAGRFDRQVLVDRPDRSGRLEILKVHAQGVLVAKDVDLGAIATQTSGFTGADLANLINEAALLAARHNRQAVIMADFREAMERVVAGLELRSRILSPIERKTVAYHEVGHAIVGALMPGGTQVSKISIVPRGKGALGYTMQTPEEDRYLMLEDELRGQLATLLGGRAAEEVVFGKVSSGASDDIQKATDLAERAVTQYGMAPDLGPIAFAKTQSEFLGSDTTRRPMSGEVAAEIDRLVKQSIHQAHGVAKSVLMLNRDLLDSMAQTLLTEDVLEGDQLKAMLTQARSPVNTQIWLAKGRVV
ncbi:ATP-dependent zinc metalloprotease FtsH [Leptothoe sp. PORK10 BA2]|uniref:ATP-dependent zinc metalloprotease FtsH n=1 Tax=Leptothoe sp. PORK10 BA2 TaxID=3110254 RepID=UPI002B1F636E|nr:ATP-dependent zinc metalloprotease FtsH [Leptothoe sp. PORK10 BA2]MEA5466297.1 ATP-dependent zinc metalloprotease FtsH [Leptothoe sp. PORK10 BA2]